MNQHEAVAAITENAIRHIREFALDAIKTVVTLSPTAEEEIQKQLTMVVEEKSSQVARPRGRPRNTDARVETPVSVAVKAPISLTSNKVETEETEEEVTVFSIADKSFPTYGVVWFTENLEQGREICRALTSTRLQMVGGDVNIAKKEMMDVTNRGAVKDFDGKACFDYYNFITVMLKNETDSSEA